MLAEVLGLLPSLLIPISFSGEEHSANSLLCSHREPQAVAMGEQAGLGREVPFGCSLAGK